jgi:uncharacterized membrane-anchored protein
MSRRRRIVLLVAVLAQLAVPLALAGFAAADLAFGREVRLLAQPVDPLDVFRGNYVVLRYELSRLMTPFPVTRGQRVCAPLHEENGVWNAGFAVPERPPDDVVICGRARRDAEADGSVDVEYGIETYYASAERAREIEGAIGRVPVYVVIDLDDDGSARIERLEFEPTG